MQANSLKKKVALVVLGVAALATGVHAQAQGLRMPGDTAPQSGAAIRQPAAPAARPASSASPTPARPAAAPSPRAQGAAAPRAATPGAAAPRAATRGASAPAAAAPVPGQSQLGDAIVAVVNNDIITRRELDERVASTRRTLAAQGIPAPETAVLERQMLERMITDKAQLQEADRAGIRVSEEQLDITISRIAEQNNITTAQLREQLQADGLTWQQYRKELSDQIRMTRLREQEVDRSIIVSEAEVDAFLAEQASRSSRPGAPAMNGAMQLAQILVRVPEGSSPQQISALRAKAEDLLRRARGGADFAQLAAAGSDGDEAMRGGDMGVRPVVGWPDLFVQAVANLQAGQVSDIVQSGNGFHILKVVGRDGARQTGPAGAPDPGPTQVTQSLVEHILIKTSAVVSDDQARSQLLQIRDRISHGQASFADMARQYSEDASAPQGGEIGWVSPGETVPAFERAMNALQPGQMSEPVKSEFGWHLLHVTDRRVQDVTDQARRMQARQTLFQRKLEPAWEEWVGMVRGRAYVDNRLTQAAR